MVLLEPLARKVVEQPHPLIGPGRACCEAAIQYQQHLADHQPITKRRQAVRNHYRANSFRGWDRPIAAQKVSTSYSVTE